MLAASGSIQSQGPHSQVTATSWADVARVDLVQICGAALLVVTYLIRLSLQRCTELSR